MQQTCPLSFEQIDNTKARLISFETLLLLLLFYGTKSVFILLFIVIDLSMRLFGKSKFSPLFIVATFVQKTLKLQSRYKDSGAKELAGYFGLLFLALLSLFSLFHIQYALMIILIIYAFCLFLDALFDYCIGCQIYYIIKKFYPNFLE